MLTLPFLHSFLGPFCDHLSLSQQIITVQYNVYAFNLSRVTRFLTL